MEYQPTKSIETSGLRIPLTKHDHQIALCFSAEQETTAKGKQVYLNTLAVIAVHKCLKWVGIETSLESSDSWHPGRRSIFDVADLFIPDYGRIECRPVLPHQTHVTLPPEAIENRRGCVAVQFYKHMNSVQVLGFKLFKKYIEDTEENINLKDFEAFENIFDTIPGTPTPISVPDLFNENLESAKELGWLTSDNEHIRKIFKEANMSRQLSKDVVKKSEVVLHKIVELEQSYIEYQILVTVIFTFVDEFKKNIILQLLDLKSTEFVKTVLLKYCDANRNSEQFNIVFKDNNNFAEVFTDQKVNEVFTFNLISENRNFSASFII
jgi:hypothetical protein